jgi:hypothetical protein
MNPVHLDELLHIIRDVRTRWRWKVVLRSLAVLVGAAVGTLLVAAYGLEQFRFSAPAIVVARVATYLVLAVLGWFFFVRPLARRVTDQQVALYLEEHEPSFQALLLSAVEAGDGPDRGALAGESVQLLRRVVESAVVRCQEAQFGRRLERRSVRRSVVALVALFVVTAIVYTIGPAYLRHGALAVLVPAGNVEAASPYRIDVRPGNATIARGADVSIAATLVGFTSTEVDVFTRSRTGEPFERAPLVATGVPSAFEATLFRVRESIEYFVQAAGVRSPVFTLNAADLPFVERLELEYVFPSYTGVPPRKVDDGGDIAAVRGTRVHLRAYSTMPTRNGRVVGDGRAPISLAAAPDGALAGSLQITEDGTYRIELQAADGTFVTASPQHTIDVLGDEAPVVVFSKPKRDLRATSIDEIFVEAEAADDFGVRQLDLVYAVNGGQERTVRLVGPSARPLRDVTAGHTFFLEELGLQPGDVVSYFARATDNDEVLGAKSATSDIYFVQIQPFRKDYRRAESQAGGQESGRAGGAGGGSDPSALSEQQRRIVAGTFNVVRDKDKAGAEKFQQDVVFLALTQGQLRERALALSLQIVARVGQSDAEMKVIAAGLADAARAMAAAERKLQVRDPKGALPPEQQALAGLLRAEEAYRDVRIRLDRQQGGGRGGGGGQGGSAAASELADLFQLEMDKLRNQYETFQRAQQQAANNKVDEMLERLKELARRQEQEAERQRQLAGRGAQASGGAGASAARQRQLADETEAAARQLERLSREEGREDLSETARGLRSAADAMRRAAAAGDASAFARAREAADRITQARDRLTGQRNDRMARDIEEARARVQRLARQQKDNERDVRGLDQAGANRDTKVQQLLERKDVQAAEVGEIERQLDKTASDFRRERQQASRKVQEAADAIRDSRLKEKIRYSKGLVQGAPADAAAGFEAQIGSDLSSIDQHLQQAAQAIGVPERDARADALARARELLRGAESMGQRLQEQAGGGRAGRGDQGAEAGRGDTASADAAGRGREGGGREGSGREGGGGREGQRGASGDALARDPRGQPGGAGRPGTQDARPGLDPRQFQREMRERRDEAQALRRDLQALGVETGELDAIVRDMAALEAARIPTDVPGIAQLQGQLVQGLRRFEFNLRRKLGASTAEQLFLSGSDDAPAEYRKLIEDYYRALAKERKR